MTTEEINAHEITKAQLRAWVRYSNELTVRVNEFEVAKQAADKLISELETGLNRMVTLVENIQQDTEGEFPDPDAGCIECTSGTVPDRLNTGLCALHSAKQLLGHT
jgi:hypothetical protein